jgi:hypothetical protein
LRRTRMKEIAANFKWLSNIILETLRTSTKDLSGHFIFDSKFEV